MNASKLYGWYKVLSWDTWDTLTMWVDGLTFFEARAHAAMVLRCDPDGVLLRDANGWRV